MHKKGDDGPLGPNVDVQRLSIVSNKDSLFQDLRQAVTENFDDIKEENTTFDLFWKDEENDYIKIFNNVKLLHAIDEMGGPVIKLYAIIMPDITDGESSINDDGE